MRLVNSTGRRASIRMSTIGWATRSSTTPQTTKSTTEPTNRPRIAGDPQPQLSPSVTPTSRHDQAAPTAAAAPATSSREGARTCDSGTKRHTSTSATATMIALTTNSQRQDRWSMITPAERDAHAAADAEHGRDQAHRHGAAVLAGTRRG